MSGRSTPFLQELDGNLVSVRGRGTGQEEAEHGQMPFVDFKARLLEEARPPEKVAEVGVSS